jgi:hypothetical protein
MDLETMETLGRMNLKTIGRMNLKINGDFAM